LPESIPQWGAAGMRAGTNARLSTAQRRPPAVGKELDQKKGLTEAVSKSTRAGRLTGAQKKCEIRLASFDGWAKLPLSRIPQTSLLDKNGFIRPPSQGFARRTTASPKPDSMDPLAPDAARRSLALPVFLTAQTGL